MTHPPYSAAPRGAVRRGRWVAPLCCIAAAALSCGVPRRDRPVDTTPVALTLRAADHRELAATLYPAPVAGAAPGLVLIHMQGADRARWERFAAAAQREGMACIAFDARGHGESKGDLSFREFGRDDWMRVLLDIHAAHLALLEHGADPDNLALIGAGIGGNLALHYAVRDERIQAVVLVSPGLDFHGVTTGPELDAYGKRPSLLVTAKGDSYSAMSGLTLREQAPGFCELREYEGAAHGHDLLDNAEGATAQILFWLKAIIGPEAARQERERRGDTQGE